MFEIAPTDLGKLMRQIFQNKEEAKKRGAAGRARVEAEWTWKHTAQKALERLNALPYSTMCVKCQREIESTAGYGGRFGGNWDQVVDHDSADTSHVNLSDLEVDLSR